MCNEVGIRTTQQKYNWMHQSNKNKLSAILTIDHQQIVMFSNTSKHASVILIYIKSALIMYHVVVFTHKYSTIEYTIFVLVSNSSQSSQLPVIMNSLSFRCWFF